MKKKIPIIVIASILLLVIIGYIGFQIGGSSEENLSIEKNSGNIGLNVGDFAPDFTTRTSTGETLQLSDFEGRVLVMTSTATWCSTCIIEAKNFAPVYKIFEGENVDFLSISIDPSEGDPELEAFKKTYGTPWYYASAITSKQLIIDYKLTRFEITYIIDQDGIIRFRDTGITQSNTLEEELNNLL